MLVTKCIGLDIADGRPIGAVMLKLSYKSWSTFSIGHHYWIPYSTVVLCHFVHSVHFPIVLLYCFKSDDQY